MGGREMTESIYLDPEDEAFNELERISKVKQEIVKMTQDREKLLNMDRNKVIEEIAQHIEKMQGFGQDTVSSFAIYIRGMK
jgi:UDP-N-acetylmuramyl pentapeptide synthase